MPEETARFKTPKFLFILPILFSVAFFIFFACVTISIPPSFHGSAIEYFVRGIEIEGLSYVLYALKEHFAEIGKYPPLLLLDLSLSGAGFGIGALIESFLYKARKRNRMEMIVQKYQNGVNNGDMVAMKTLEEYYRKFGYYSQANELEDKFEKKAAENRLSYAIQQYGKAAENGDVDAMKKLIDFYTKADPVGYKTKIAALKNKVFTVVMEKAIQDYGEKAKKGDAYATYLLAESTEKASEYVTDPNERSNILTHAFELYYEAARRGEDNAYVSVYKCYKDGIGVKQDPYRAEYWIEKAEAAGHTTIGRIMDRKKREEALMKQADSTTAILNAFTELQKQNESLQRQNEKIARQKMEKIDELNSSLKRIQEQNKELEDELWRLNNK